ncbi:hypothetical protein PPSIR1_24159 [Plesiocystis pacifica SIR-1]|uniref:Fe2OG dioxygenase domain-containing protein n=1 Tax=Plesiocystis pacifica SIR-1 TaxID=391625 RepID=A6GBZ6_9BACT|nr:hypothetical protein [Plesiocystis pacifica]EDM76558.1 hypothetical protein PPSIR1_24159 [Plesiocystis pacifica SIR-1]
MTDPTLPSVRDPAFAQALAFAELPPDQRRRVGDELRDWFFELCAAGSEGSPDQRARLRKVAAAVELAPGELGCIDGLSLAPHPTARHQSVRFVQLAELPEALRPRCARPSPAAPELAAVFVDPEEFSFRSFENIVPLDALLEPQLGEPMRLAKVRRCGAARSASAYLYRLHAPDSALAALTRLDTLGLYRPPFNAGSRGGERFIFHSASLAAALTQALRDALPPAWAQGFTHLNPVFRCNRFRPGDAPFTRHVDTPYYDPNQRQVSRYTLLLYLRGGATEAGPATLDIEDPAGPIELRALEAFDCVLFPQDRPHAGAPFDAGDKVFLRTELIFELQGEVVEHRQSIAALFSKACYLDGESVFAPELQRHAAARYDRAARAHWGVREAAAQSREAVEPYVHKRFRGLEFVTNGHDYYFTKKAASLRECAAVAILDLLNARVVPRPEDTTNDERLGDALGLGCFRKLCEREVFELGGETDPAEAIAARLADARACAEAPLLPSDDALLDPLFPPAETPAPELCCPFHTWPAWDATRHDETIDLYERAQGFARRRIRGAPLLALGEQLYLDLDRFVVEGDKIHVLSDTALSPVNFAACWNDETRPPNYIDTELTLEAPHLLLPPIAFAQLGELVHLSLDLFRNTWMLRARPQPVPVPRIRNLGQEDFEEVGDPSALASPWMEAAGITLSGTTPSLPTGPSPWWAYFGSDHVAEIDPEAALLRELYGDLHEAES